MGRNQNGGSLDNGCKEPLPPQKTGADATEKNARPNDHLTKVIRAADNTVQACVDKTSGITSLGGGFLRITGGFQKNPAQNKGGSNPRPDFGGLNSLVLKPEQQAGRITGASL